MTDTPDTTALILEAAKLLREERESLADCIRINGMLSDHPEDAAMRADIARIDAWLDRAAAAMGFLK